MGIVWVLLGGDIDLVPTRVTNVDIFGPYGDHITTDYYYACLEGNWNFDGDGYYDEWDDSLNLDLYSELFVGRVPVKTQVEAEQYVSKVLTYEKTPPTDYITKALFLGTNMF